MFPANLIAPALAPAMLWFSTSVKLFEMLVASSQVIAHRTQMMANAGCTPTPAERTEFFRMGAEKVVAGVEVAGLAMRGWMALWSQWANIWFALSARPFATTENLERVLHAWAAGARLGGDLVQPVHGKATANARRLAAKARGRIIEGGRRKGVATFS